MYTTELQKIYTLAGFEPVPEHKEVLMASNAVK
jgi:hypothetical protein